MAMIIMLLLLRMNGTSVILRKMLWPPGRCSTTQEYGVNGCQFTIVMMMMVKVMVVKVMMMLIIVVAGQFAKIIQIMIVIMVAMSMMMMMMTMTTFQPEVGCCQSISVWPEILVIIYEHATHRHIKSS